MNFLIVLAITIAFVLLFRKLIKKYSVLFYVLAIGLNVLFFVNTSGVFPRVVSNMLFLFMQKCTLSLALFTIVMFIGVFSRDSRVRAYLMPIRAELSIIAWIVSLGHMTMYALSYLPRLGGGFSTIGTNILISFGIALILFVLLLVLGVTSFDAVKKHMNAVSWKRLQRFSYLFFGLVYAHLMIILLPAALRGGAIAQVNLAVYSAIFASYVIARLVRAYRDQNMPDASIESAAAVDKVSLG